MTGTLAERDSVGRVLCLGFLQVSMALKVLRNFLFFSPYIRGLNAELPYANRLVMKSAAEGISCCLNAAHTFRAKKGSQQRRNTPMTINTVIASFFSSASCTSDRFFFKDINVRFQQAAGEQSVSTCCWHPS
jgi:hypothetical protein